MHPREITADTIYTLGQKYHSKQNHIFKDKKEIIFP